MSVLGPAYGIPTQGDPIHRPIPRSNASLREATTEDLHRWLNGYPRYVSEAAHTRVVNELVDRGEVVV